MAAGIWLGVSLMKFGNPIIFGGMITPPTNLAEFIFIAWPLWWGYIFFGVALLAALPIVFKSKPWAEEGKGIRLVLGLLGFWLFWQFLSSTRSVDPRLTRPTLVHFTSCALAFVLGWRGLIQTRSSGWFWTPLFIGFFYVLVSGFDQHNGGLDATREAFYAQPDWQTYPPEYLLKMESNRIFGPLVYPNALAQLIILLFPVCLWQFWELTVRWHRIARLVFAGLFAYLALACLYWTGSKGGWLVALFIGAVLFLHLKVQPRVKWICVSAGLVLGLLLFFIRFNAYFEKGATSVGARFTYWDAAVKTAATYPVFGSGPGTFSVSYKKLKSSDAEMAKLTHNDYLEQASDSGIPGALAFTGFVVTSLVVLYRKSLRIGPAAFLTWLGILGWALQAFIEFGLYIPALAWPMFAFCGLLWGISKGVKETNSGLFIAR